MRFPPAGEGERREHLDDVDDHHEHDEDFIDRLAADARDDEISAGSWSV